MNILGLIFSMILILSYGFYASWDKQQSAHRLNASFLGHEKAERKLHNAYQSTVYKNLSGKSISPEKPKGEGMKKAKRAIRNRECSKINLKPLIQDGKTAHPLLYELMAKMLRTYYGRLCTEKRFEYQLLDELIKEAKGGLVLEKLEMGRFRKLYYKMLKGTKEWNLAKGFGYPSLLEYVKVEEGTDKLCLFHAHPDVMAICFNFKVAAALHEEIQKEGAPLLTKELVERICSEHHFTGLDQNLFAILELGNPEHKEHKKTFLAKEGGVALKRQVYFE